MAWTDSFMHSYRARRSLSSCLNPGRQVPTKMLASLVRSFSPFFEWEGAFPFSGELWRTASVVRAYLRRRFLPMHFHRCGSSGTKRLGTRAFPLVGRHWNRRGVGACRNLCSGGVAEDRRKMGAGYLQNRILLRFFIAAALNYTVGARFGWRAMFLCGLSPGAVSLIITLRVKEPARWKQRTDEGLDKRAGMGIFSPKYRKRTIVNAALLTVAIIGLWAGSVYEPIAIITLAKKAGMTVVEASKTASFGTVILSIGTILGCLAVPILAERLGRKKTLTVYFAGMCVFISLTFGWVFYLVNGLRPFIACLFFLGFFGGNFALFSLWLPEQYDTSGSCNGLFVCDFFRKVCRSRREFFDRCIGSSCRNNRETCSVYSYRLRVWTADHSVRTGNPERTVAGLKGI